MKTTIHFLTVILIMNITLLYAGDPNPIILKANVNSSTLSLNHIELAPVTPKEANFTDCDLLPFSAINHLAPITPKEATFEDFSFESEIISINPELLQKITPTTPKEAGFWDSESESITGIDLLVPVYPQEAEFDE